MGIKLLVGKSLLSAEDGVLQDLCAKFESLNFKRVSNWGYTFSIQSRTENQKDYMYLLQEITNQDDGQAFVLINNKTMEVKGSFDKFVQKVFGKQQSSPNLAAIRAKNTINIKGFKYSTGDFLVSVGLVYKMDTLVGLIIEIEYLPCELSGMSDLLEEFFAKIIQPFAPPESLKFNPKKKQKNDQEVPHTLYTPSQIISQYYEYNIPRVKHPDDSELIRIIKPNLNRKKGMYQWRRFQFFDKELIKEKGEDNKPSLQNLDISCSCSGKGKLLFGDSNGFILMVERDFTTKGFPAFTKAIHQIQVKQRNYIVGLGSDDENLSTSIIRIWNTERDDKSGTPLLVKSIPITLKTRTQVTCFAAREDLSQLAVGLMDGSVILYYNDILRSPNQKVIKTQDAHNICPVTSIGWKEAGLNSHLFVVTSNSILVYNSAFQPDTLDPHGCEQGCAIMSDDGDLVVGRQEAIYFYSPEGRGACLAFEGEKKLLSWFRNNLIVVGSGNIQNLNSFNIYDMKNKLNAFSGSFQNVSHVLSEWGTIFVFTRDGNKGKGYQIEEKDTQTKLDTLFKKNFYDIAINLAQSQNYDYNSVIDIYRKYGDHLYSKGNFDGAINQYLKTIGGLEPSYVIRKFLDAQRIHNLTSYLQALHEQNRANPDHTTLLLNCYTKLKDDKKLQEFIAHDSGFKFDVGTAIKVCRQAGYFTAALTLSQTHFQHDWFLKILLEDLNDYEKALEYISTLTFNEAESNMKIYGKTMMSMLPEKTTQFLKELCTVYVPKISEEFPPPEGSLVSVLQDLSILMAADSIAKAEDFIQIFLDKDAFLMDFLSHIVATDNAHSPIIFDTLLELYLQEYSKNPNNDYLLNKANDLLTSEKAVFNDNQALVLCKRYKFKAGVLHLYERNQMYNEIVEYHMGKGEYEELVRACKKFGSTDPNLWIQTLSYFSAQNNAQAQSKISDVLNHIDKNNLLPPLLVLQILANDTDKGEKVNLSKPAISLGVIKDYIVQRLERDNQQIADELKRINDSTEETERMKATMENLRTSAKTFQSNKCVVCNTALDLPAVHFLCMHSYHLRCMGENERECLKCANENRKILEIRKSLEDNVGKHDQFFKQLELSEDGFAIAAEYFGRGLFSKPAIPDQKR